jgi:hypothetical protein
MSLPRLKPLKLLPPQEDPFTKQALSEAEFNQCLSRPCDESEFILLASRYLQQINKGAPLDLTEIYKNYLNGKNKEAIAAIQKLANDCKRLDPSNPAYDALIYKSKTLNEIEIYKNYAKRFFENRLAQFYEGNAASAAIPSVNAVLSKYYKKPITTADDLFTAIVGLETAYSTCRVQLADSEPDVNYFSQTTSQADQELILCGKKLFHIDRINNTLTCLAPSLNPDQIKQFTEIFQSNTILAASYAKRLMKNIADLELPNVITRGEAIKKISDIYNLKDRAYKEDLFSYPIPSMNLGVMTSLTPNYPDERSTQTSLNRNPDRGFMSNESGGYSKTHINHPFVGSVSGHCYGMVAILEDFCERNKLSPSLAKDINTTLQAFILTFINYGFHSYGEIVDVLTRPEIGTVFSKYNVKLELDLPPAILESAFRHATEYAKTLALKDSLHFNIFKKAVETKQWEACCKIVSPLSQTKIFHYLKEASLSKDNLNSLYKYAEEQGYTLLADVILTKFTKQLSLDIDSYSLDLKVYMTKDILARDFHQYKQLREGIEKNPALTSGQIQGLSILGQLNCASYSDFTQAILEQKSNEEITALLLKIEDFAQNRYSCPIDFLGDKKIRKAIIDNENIDLHLTTLEIYKNSLEANKEIVSLIKASSHPLTLTKAIAQLKTASLLTDTILMKLAAHPKHSLDFVSMVSRFNEFNISEDQQKVLFSILDKNPDYIKIITSAMDLKQFNYKLLTGEFIDITHINEFNYSQLFEMLEAKLLDKYKPIFLKYSDVDFYKEIDKLNLDMKLISAIVNFMSDSQREDNETGLAESKTRLIETFRQTSSAEQMKLLTVLPKVNTTTLTLLLREDSLKEVFSQASFSLSQISTLLDGLYRDEDQIRLLTILGGKLPTLLTQGAAIDSFLNSVSYDARDSFYELFVKVLVAGAPDKDKAFDKIAPYQDNPSVYSRLSTEVLKQAPFSDKVVSKSIRAKLLLFSTDNPVETPQLDNKDKPKSQPPSF